jgi:hypothetical protein
MTIVEIDYGIYPDNEQLAAEIYFDYEHWGTITQEKGPLILEIYPKLDGGPYILNIEDVLSALQEAKLRLLGTQPEASS